MRGQLMTQKKKRFSWDYYRPGMKYAAVKILEVKNQGVNQRNTIYKVRCDCCGDEAEITHERINHRITNDVASCGKCARGNWSFYKEGEIIAGYEIISRISGGRQTQKNTIYKVKTTCCGKKIDCSHYLLVRRRNDGTTVCRDCAILHANETRKGPTRGKSRVLRDQRRRERRLKKELEYSTANNPYGVKFRPEWPVPSYVPIGVYVLWEDGMRT